MKILASIIMFLSLSLASSAMVTGSTIQLLIGGADAGSSAISSPFASPEFAVTIGGSAVSIDISSVVVGSSDIPEGRVDIVFTDAYLGSNINIQFFDQLGVINNFTSYTLNSISTPVVGGTASAGHTGQRLVLAIVRTAAPTPLSIAAGTTISLGFTTVPEAGSLALMGMSMGAALFIRRRITLRADAA